MYFFLLGFFFLNAKLTLYVGFSFVGIVGEADENGEDYYLWTYKKLEIGFNGNRIVDVNLTSEGKVKLVPNTKIQMSYSVSIKIVVYKNKCLCFSINN